MSDASDPRTPPHPHDTAPDASAAPDESGYSRRVRRAADMSQRDLADALEIDRARVARVETGQVHLTVPEFARMLAVGGLRLAVVDRAGAEVHPVSPDSVMDGAGRRYPAHLDVRTLTDRPYRVVLEEHRYAHPRSTWYELRSARDRHRALSGRSVNDSVLPLADQPTADEVARIDREVFMRRRQRRSSDRRTSAIDDLDLDFDEYFE
jgi:HTH-type transcriptional regulator/antitoxin HipB